MNTLDKILEHYAEQKQPLTEEQRKQIQTEADEHLCNYLLGDGESRHLYNYYDCMEKLS
jgi:hypothetical protein